MCLPVQTDLQSDCDEKGICNPQLKDRANGEGLQIPLFKAAGLQIRPNRYNDGWFLSTANWVTGDYEWPSGQGFHFNMFYGFNEIN